MSVIDKENGLRDYLEHEYGIDVLGIEPVKNVFRISTPAGDMCLKRMKYDRRVSLFIMSAMDHLVKNGYGMILTVLPTVDGRDYVELDGGFGFMTGWVPSRECDYSNPIELKMAARSLAKLHNASEGFVPQELIDDRYGFGKWSVKFQKRIREMKTFKDMILAKGKRSYFDGMYLDSVDYFVSQGEAAVEHLEKSRYFELMEREKQKNGFCHHDFAHHNVLISDCLKAYIIDFDYCISDTRLHDLGSLIIRNMRHRNWNMEKAQFIVDSYLIDGHLELDEIPVINAFIEFPQDFWQVGLQYYVEKLKWDEEHFNKRLQRCVLDRDDKRDFVKWFGCCIKI